MRFVSHAQNFEDVLLYRALRHIERGFYVDIGAQDPVIDSVSLAFYDRGWRGVHVEPSPFFAGKLREHRPDETVLEFAVGAVPGTIRFYEIPETGLSTAEERIAVQHRDSGYAPREITVECKTLTELLGPYRVRDIHWMKIDVEGMEREVIEGWDRRALRPWIIVVEATEPLTQVRVHAGWEPLLLDAGYLFAFFDGLNRYFVAAERPELLASFDRPANVFDDFALSGVASNSFSALQKERIGELERLLQRTRLEVANAEQRLENAEVEVIRLKRRIAAQKDEVVQLNERMRRESAHLNAHISSLDGEIGRLKRHIDWQQREWDAASSEAAVRASELEAMRCSLSWRITAPLRRLNAVRRGGMKYLRRVVGTVKQVTQAPARERPTHVALWLLRRPILLRVVRTAVLPLPGGRIRFNKHVALARTSAEQAVAKQREVATAPVAGPQRPMSPHAARVLHDLREAMDRP